MHNLSVPSFFLAKRIGDPQGEELARMYRLSSNSFICFFNSTNSDDAILYGFLYMGVVPGASSMLNSISRSGGMPGSSSGNTSGNSHTTGTLFSSDTCTLFNLGCRGYFSFLGGYPYCLPEVMREDYVPVETVNETFICG